MWACVQLIFMGMLGSSEWSHTNFKTVVTNFELYLVTNYLSWVSNTLYCYIGESLQIGSGKLVTVGSTPLPQTSAGFSVSHCWILMFPLKGFHLSWEVLAITKFRYYFFIYLRTSLKMRLSIWTGCLRRHYCLTWQRWECNIQRTSWLTVYMFRKVNWM